MLYDRRWDTKTKPDIYALTTLIAWLEKQPARRAYRYDHGGRCILSQYFSEQLGQRVNVGFCFVIDEKGKYGRLTPGFNNIATRIPHTYGAALARARALHDGKS